MMLHIQRQRSTVTGRSAFDGPGSLFHCFIILFIYHLLSGDQVSDLLSPSITFSMPSMEN